jgi:hypothetical protein
VLNDVNTVVYVLVSYCVEVVICPWITVVITVTGKVEVCVIVERCVDTVGEVNVPGPGTKAGDEDVVDVAVDDNADVVVDEDVEVVVDDVVVDEDVGAGPHTPLPTRFVSNVTAPFSA